MLSELLHSQTAGQGWTRLSTFDIMETIQWLAILHFLYSVTTSSNLGQLERNCH